MRIIGGKNRGTKLLAPPGFVTRPTSDRARESLFNILIHNYPADIRGAEVLDIFAGSGALGLEALSRGAKALRLIEQDKAALASIRVNIRACQAEGKARIISGDARRLMPTTNPAGLVFMDPPYHEDLASPMLQDLAKKGWLAEGALLVVETGPGDALNLPLFFTLEDERKWGKARVHFLRYSRVKNV